MKKINPLFKEFASRYENVTLLGLYWAMMWRFMLLAYSTLFVIGIIGIVIGAIFGIE